MLSQHEQCFIYERMSIFIGLFRNRLPNEKIIFGIEKRKRFELRRTQGFFPARPPTRTNESQYIFSENSRQAFFHAIR